jgi:hypothetical protein
MLGGCHVGRRPEGAVFDTGPAGERPQLSRKRCV